MNFKSSSSPLFSFLRKEIKRYTKILTPVDRLAKILITVMTCFWDGIAQSITLQEVNTYLTMSTEYLSMPHIKVLVMLVKLKIKDVSPRDIHSCVGWSNDPVSNANDKILSVQTISESITWICDYDENNISQGHDCSSCDPFLIAICYLFEVNIIHSNNGTKIYYTFKRPRKTLNFASNTGHFWAV